jgi:hypothetical protein
MGLYSRLVVPRPLPCPQCGSQADLVVQFHFGSKRMQNFSIGSAIDWSGRTEGSPRSGRFGVVGYLEPCPSCGHDDDTLCVVEFHGDVIVGYRAATEEDMREFEW